MSIPPSLQSNDPTNAIALVGAYYASRFDDFSSRTDDPKYFSGAFFDNCSPYPADANKFTAADVLALPMLSIPLHRFRTAEVLYYRQETLSELLERIGPDRDLATVPCPLPDDWPASQLEQELLNIKGVGKVTATKLIARKRPRLFPIFDKVVKGSVAPDTVYLDTVHVELRSNDNLRGRIGEIRSAVGLPETISELRIFDVVAWMEAQHPEQVTYQAPPGARTFMVE